MKNLLQYQNMDLPVNIGISGNCMIYPYCKRVNVHEPASREALTGRIMFYFINPLKALF